MVVNTFRFDGKEEVHYYATLYTGKRFYHSAEYASTKVTDRVGSGDCFMAGLIYGLYHELPSAAVLAFATNAAFKQLFVKGDATDKSVQEIKMAIQ